LRTLLGAFRACPAPRRERRSRGDRPTISVTRDAWPVFRGCALIPWEAAVAGRPPYRRTAMERRPYRFGHAGRVTLPCGRDKRDRSRGFGPVAGTRCRFSPRDSVTKSRTRRCQRSVLRSPSQFLPKGTRKSIPHSPAQRKRDLWKLKFRARMGVRRRGVPCRRLEGGFLS